MKSKEMVYKGLDIFHDRTAYLPSKSVEIGKDPINSAHTKISVRSQGNGKFKQTWETSTLPP